MTEWIVHLVELLRSRKGGLVYGARLLSGNTRTRLKVLVVCAHLSFEQLLAKLKKARM